MEKELSYEGETLSIDRTAEEQLRWILSESGVEPLLADIYVSEFFDVFFSDGQVAIIDAREQVLLDILSTMNIDAYKEQAAVILLGAMNSDWEPEVFENEHVRFLLLRESQKIRHAKWKAKNR